jgi:hypothetical protein
MAGIASLRCIKKLKFARPELRDYLFSIDGWHCQLALHKKNKILPAPRVGDYLFRDDGCHCQPSSLKRKSPAPMLGAGARGWGFFFRFL